MDPQTSVQQTDTMPKSADTAVRAHRPMLLRHASQSDPHLDIPKTNFLRPESNFATSIHNLLSGIFEGGGHFVALSEHRSKANEQMDSTFEQQPISSRLDRNKSAAELTTAASSNSLCSEESAEKPLRKVSSTAYNFAPSDNIKGDSSHYSPPSVLSHWWNSHIGGSTHSISKIPEEDQGLTMSVGQPTSSSTAGPLAAARSAGLFDSANTNANSPAAQAGSSDATAANPSSRHPFGGMISLFGRGFLGKPVLRSEADNYRYIMALDR